MKRTTAALSIAALSLAILTPAFGQNADPGSQDNHAIGANEAQHMVPARASLTRALEASKVHQGDQFRATLSDNVRLNNGVELRHGDVLLGKVVADDMNTPGNARLAVRFTEAVQKDGQKVPIKATIVALYQPDELVNSYSDAEQVPNSWNDGTLNVDAVGVVGGVDLHSRISSQNSGVFVSTTKSNFKIPAGSEIALAIAAEPNAASTNPGE